MWQHPFSVYGITRESGFDEQGASLVGSIVLCDQLMADLEWLLSRDPFIFPAVRDSLVRVATTRTQPPPLVLFVVDKPAGQVHLRWVDLAAE